MSEFEKPPPYSPEAPPPIASPPAGYQGFPYVPSNYPPPPSRNVQRGIPPGYQIVSTPPPLTTYGSTVYVQQSPPVAPQVILVGGCPACRVGVLEDDFTCLGVCLAILFFPLGILCCLAMMQRRCPNCGAVFN